MLIVLGPGEWASAIHIGNNLYFTAAHTIRSWWRGLQPFQSVYGFTVLGQPGPRSERTPIDLHWDCAVDLQAILPAATRELLPLEGSRMIGVMTAGDQSPGRVGTQGAASEDP